jgi:DNA-binding NtrC family response regulator
VPALADRKEDIPLLVEKFLQDISQEYGSRKKTVESKALKLMEAHPWSGNIRELRNVVERLVIMSGDSISPEDVRKYL